MLMTCVSVSVDADELRLQVKDSAAYLYDAVALMAQLQHLEASMSREHIYKNINEFDFTGTATICLLCAVTQYLYTVY